MAAMSITQISMLKLTRAFPQSPSLSHLPPKVSSVCFTSASKHSQGGNAGYSSSDSDSDIEDKAKEDTAAAAVEAAKHGTHKTTEAAGTVAEKAKDGAYKTGETVVETVKEGTSKAKQTVQGVVKETTHKIKETVVGKDDDDKYIDDFIEDHASKPKAEHGGGENAVDEDVVEVRWQAGGHDGEKKR
ncbi:hypothetical protein Acr_18g0003710 [Actinidia rufa]|uniref:Uncharacterized protein n=1 Tax=Actinidia rufa TaxID=165716 RepID=A0A7J0G5Z1_9ERIC|nr:hypothetical protein Acr_18g0003710 [Actinidia rufa]